MDTKTENWIKLSEYDYKTAKAMLDTGRYLYVAFTCQQAIEKLLKALFVHTKKTFPPYTHNLVRLVKEIGLEDISVEYVDFLNYLNAYYIETRYTETLEAMSKGLNTKKANVIYTQTGEILQWLKSKIS